MASEHSGVYIQDGFSEPMSAQHSFMNNFNVHDPDQAMSMYARIMHQHTKHQLDTATHSSRRRSNGGSTPSLDSSNNGSVSSTEP
ncbi:hypothetical protein M501DRAFT_929322 [Patellaria atrata CBS 101060]|uniref:Uncharacterized protein n=1 Tax=Patellaria atrata CBS 101060 TaxID=1346257 RepID=A0A9P4VPY0_9PEZI|nr:hypothetical protein M501DRAFT_929322 [Patellaria atrata CBS 101060]